MCGLQGAGVVLRCYEYKLTLITADHAARYCRLHVVMHEMHAMIWCMLRCFVTLQSTHYISIHPSLHPPWHHRHKMWFRSQPLCFNWYCVSHDQLYMEQLTAVVSWEGRRWGVVGVEVGVALGSCRWAWHLVLGTGGNLLEWLVNMVTVVSVLAHIEAGWGVIQH